MSSSWNDQSQWLDDIDVAIILEQTITIMLKRKVVANRLHQLASADRFVIGISFVLISDLSWSNDGS